MLIRTFFGSVRRNDVFFVLFVVFFGFRPPGALAVFDPDVQLVYRAAQLQVVLGERLGIELVCVLGKRRDGLNRGDVDLRAEDLLFSDLHVPGV
jgi:hypothetical protein